MCIRSNLGYAERGKKREGNIAREGRERERKRGRERERERERREGGRERE